VNCASPTKPHKLHNGLAAVERLRRLCSSLTLAAILLMFAGCQMGPNSLGGLSRVPPPGTVNGYTNTGGYYGISPAGAVPTAGAPRTSGVVPGSVAPVAYNGQVGGPVTSAAYNQQASAVNNTTMGSSSLRSGPMIPATDLTLIGGGQPSANSVQPAYTASAAATEGVSSSFSDRVAPVNSGANLPSTAGPSTSSGSEPGALPSNASESSAFNFPDAPQQQWK